MHFKYKICKKNIKFRWLGYFVIQTFTSIATLLHHNIIIFLFSRRLAITRSFITLFCDSFLIYRPTQECDAAEITIRLFL